jgi:hypothetical protein
MTIIVETQVMVKLCGATPQIQSRDGNTVIQSNHHTLLLMLSLMEVSSLIPNKVLVCGGRHLSKEESNGSGKLESRTEKTAVEIDCRELR